MKLVVAVVAMSACASAPGEVGENDRLTVIDQAVEIQPRSSLVQTIAKT